MADSLKESWKCSILEVGWEWQTLLKRAGSVAYWRWAGSVRLP